MSVDLNVLAQALQQKGNRQKDRKMEGQKNKGLKDSRMDSHEYPVMLNAPINYDGNIKI